MSLRDNNSLGGCHLSHALPTLTHVVLKEEILICGLKEEICNTVSL